MAVRAPAAGERHHHDLTLEELVAQRDIHAAEIRETEIEPVTGDELRRLIGIAQRRVVVAACRETVLEGDAGPELAVERAVVGHRRVVEEHMTAVELREAQLATLQFASEEAMVAGRCEEGAGDEATGLLQFTDRRRVLAALDEGHSPAAAHIRCTGFRGALRVRAEAKCVAIARAERDLLVFALGLHHQQRSRERIALELRIDTVVEARHAQCDRVAVHRDLVDPGALRSVDQVGDATALLTHELDAERQLTARQLKHGAPHAIARAAVGEGTGGEAERRDHEQHPVERPSGRVGGGHDRSRWSEIFGGRFRRRRRGSHRCPCATAPTRVRAARRRCRTCAA